VVSAAQEALQNGLARLPELLGPWQDKEWQLQFCLCDIWRPHVLFVGDRVSGVIDYGSIKPDHVAGDVARLLGSWVMDDQELWHRGIEAYADVKPLSLHERRLVAVLDHSGTVLSLATWLLWLWRDQRTFDNVPAAAQRLNWLVERAARSARDSSVY